MSTHDHRTAMMPPTWRTGPGVTLPEGWEPEKATCVRGHPQTPANVTIYTYPHGDRFHYKTHCRLCGSARSVGRWRNGRAVGSGRHLLPAELTLLAMSSIRLPVKLADLAVHCAKLWPTVMALKGYPGLPDTQGIVRKMEQANGLISRGLVQSAKPRCWTLTEGGASVAGSLKDDLDGRPMTAATSILVKRRWKVPQPDEDYHIRLPGDGIPRRGRSKGP